LVGIGFGQLLQPIRLGKLMMPFLVSLYYNTLKYLSVLSKSSLLRSLWQRFAINTVWISALYVRVVLETPQQLTISVAE
jgi:hypothetical protein